MIPDSDTGLVTADDVVTGVAVVGAVVTEVKPDCIEGAIVDIACYEEKS